MNSNKTITNAHESYNGIETIKQYVSLRYYRWLDFSKYLCEHVGIEDESIDVLNEVILALLQKDESLLQKLFEAKKIHKGVNYNEIDWYILRMIRLNVTSNTSPYQSRYKKDKFQTDINLRKVEIIDEDPFEYDRSGNILKEMRFVRWVFSGLDLSLLERRVFQFRFFDGGNIRSEWTGTETQKECYNTYKYVETIIHQVLYLQGMTRLKPKPLTKQQSKVVDRFFSTHRIKRAQTKQCEPDYSLN